MSAELVQRISDLSSPLSPHPTGTPAELPVLEGIKAVVFDVYGTLLISASGDISLAGESAKGAALELATSAAGISLSANGDEVVERFLATIRAAHAESPEEYPEIDIRAIWREVLDSMGAYASDAEIEQLSVEYESRVNPIWPMPRMVETLMALSAGGLRLGIVSNAQFFTPLAFPALAMKPLEGWGFDPGLCVWSYKHGQAKPGMPLYQRCAAGLATHGIEPAQALYVGNDMLNDVWPAQRVGFRTALFAGDRRSLRRREDDPRLTGVTPDVVVSDLGQLLSVIGLIR